MTYSFTFAGGGSSSLNCRVGFCGTYAASGGGTFIFTPDAGAATYSYSGPGYVLTPSTSYAYVSGDNLYFQSIQSRDSGGTEQSFSVAVNFQAGYLTGAFPTVVDFSKIVGSRVSFSEDYSLGYGSSTTAFGPLTSLAVTSTSVISNYGHATALVSTDPYVAPVPEPASWTMMIVGFGAVGFAVRRRQPALRAA